MGVRHAGGFFDLVDLEGEEVLATRPLRALGAQALELRVELANGRDAACHLAARLPEAADPIEQLTVDHSLVQELTDKGFYSPKDAKRSIQKNLVTRAMGVESEVRSDLYEEDALPGDIYLLCSDGLSDLVEDRQIHLTLNKYSANLEQAAQQLIQMANQNGGTDNISVILARVLRPFSDDGRPSWYSKVVHWFG